MNSKICTPLRAALEEYRKADWSRLHMPGHKGAALEPFGNLMEYDVTEVEGTDSLFEDDGPLKELEEIFTKLYGTRSVSYTHLDVYKRQISIRCWNITVA